MKIRTMALGVAALAVVGAAGGAALLGAFRLPQLDPRPSPNSVPLIVTIVNPNNNSRWPADAYVPIMATTASASPLAALELWADERLVEGKPPDNKPGSPYLTTEWRWAPGWEGEHNLVVRATDSEGRTGTSNVVHLLASKPAGMRLAVEAKAGDTLTSLATQNKIDPQRVAADNSSLDPSKLLPVGQRVFLPIDPLPVPELAFAPPGAGASPSPGAGSPGGGTAATPGPSAGGSSAAGRGTGGGPPAGPVKLVEGLPPGGGPNLAALPGLLGKGILPGLVKKPTAPDLSAQAAGCDVNLRIVDKADNEDGFFVYRVEPGSPAFQRIATLAANGGSAPLQYTDAGRSGHLQYYVTSYNSAGEAPSQFAGIDLVDPQCSGAQTGTDSTAQGGLRFEDGRLVLPQAMDIAYFYASLNGSPSVRVPEGSDAFFTPQEGHVVDLRDLTEKLYPPPGVTKLEVDLEVWGWSGGGLVYVGKLHTTLDRTRLTVCRLGKNCVGDVAGTQRAKEATVGSDKTDQKTEFYWDTIAPQTTGALWQVATSPFAGDFSLQPSHLVGAGTAAGTSGGSFLIDFADLHKPPQRLTFLDQGSVKRAVWDKFFPAKEQGDLLAGVSNALSPDVLYHAAYMSIYPITYYVRVTPMAGTQPSGKPSDTVKITYGPTGPPATVQIMMHLPDLFEIEIVKDSYRAPVPMDRSLWGCVYIRAVDKAAFEKFPQGSLMHMTEEKMYEFYASKINWMGCPANYEEPSFWDDFKAFFEQIWEGLKAAWDAAVSAFNAIKQTLVEAAALLIEKLTPFECGSGCQSLLMTGLDIAITSLTGIPPNLPNSDELADMGIDYAIEYAASSAGVPCPPECKDVLKDGLKQVKEAAMARRSQPGCTGENWAKMYGKQPLCFPPGVKTEPVIEGTDQPAHVNVKVTRKGTGDAKQMLLGADPGKSYALRVTATNTNDAVVGKSIYYNYEYDTTEKCLMFFECGDTGTFGVSATIASPLKGELYQEQRLPLPLLPPGESVTIPLAFQRTFEYWIPEHVAAFAQALQQQGLKYSDVLGGMDGRSTMFRSWDYGCLTNGTKLKLEAEVMCLDFPGGQLSPGPGSKMVECGAKSTLELNEVRAQSYCPAY